MSRTNWEADKMLDVYIHDYFVKRNLHATARAFQAESRVSRDPVAIDAPGGFLMEWWSVFWDVFVARATKKNPHITASPAGLERQNLLLQQQQSLAPQQQGKRHQQILKQRHAHQQQFSRGSADAISSKNILPKRQKTASVNAFTSKICEGRLKLPLHEELQRPGDNPANLMEPYQMHMLQYDSVSGPLSGQTMNGISRVNSGNLPQVHKGSQLNLGIGSEMNPVAASRISGSKEPLSAMTGLDQGVCSLPLKGWPLTGLDQLQLGLLTKQKSLEELQLQQHLMLQAQQTTLTSASDLEAHSLRMRLSSNGYLNPSLGHVLPNAASSLQYDSPMLSIEDMDALIMQLLDSDQQQILYRQNSHLMQQPVNQYNLMQQEQLVNHGVMTANGSFPNALVAGNQAAENVIASKGGQPVSVASPAKSLDTANIPGPSSSSQSTLSAHVLGNATSITSKASSMFGVDATDLLKSPTTKLADMEHYRDNGSLEEHVGSPLSHDYVISNGGVGLENDREGCEVGFSLKEICLLPGGQSKIQCCDFSSDGKFLVTGGYNKKATLWCTDSFALTSELEEHSSWVTDVRFSPSMPRLATSSADKTVRIWNIDNPGFLLHAFSGHSSPAMSLDFHPSKDDLICSSDRNNEIRYWSIKSGCCSGVLKGGANHMRFQPQLGRCLAAASENVVSLLDVESQACRQKLQGHKSTVHSVCWDLTGDLLASVSDDSVRVWAVGSNVKGELVHELSSSSKKFNSCVFHPTQRSVLLIGSYQTLELWDMKGGKRTALHAHDNLISCLAASNVKGLVASASYDKCIKIWK